LELVEGITLQDYVLELPLPEMSQRFSALLGASCGLMYLHSRRPRIAHGDVKGRNVLVKVASNQVCAKISDFGLSRVLADSPQSLGFSLAWVAPEVYRFPGLPLKTSADMFCFGRIMYLTLACRRPLAGIQHEELRLMLQTSMLPALVLPGDHPIECHCAGLMDKCLRVNESHRPSMQEIHEALIGLVSQFDDAAVQHIVQSKAQLLRWSPLAVARCLEVPEPRRTRQRPPHMRLVLPELAPTSERRKCESILECVQSWNFPLPESANCCPFHAALQAVKAVACKLAQEIPCQQDFEPIGPGQCKLCGMLMFESVDTCEKCDIFSVRQSL